MSKQRQATAITIVILLLVLGFVISRNPAARATLPSLPGRAEATSSEATPQDAVYAMLDAARTGDVSKYLEAFTGELSQSLRRARDESPDFAKYLRDSNSALKGVAVMEPQTISDRELKVRVEYVYQDRNEVQQFNLEKVSGSWKISRMESAERINTPVPYGTPVQ